METKEKEVEQWKRKAQQMRIEQEQRKKEIAEQVQNLIKQPGDIQRELQQTVEDLSDQLFEKRRMANKRRLETLTRRVKEMKELVEKMKNRQYLRMKTGITQRRKTQPLITETEDQKIQSMEVVERSVKEGNFTYVSNGMKKSEKKCGIEQSENSKDRSWNPLSKSDNTRWITIVADERKSIRTKKTGSLSQPVA
ncbi:hypothetical protein EHI2019_000404300 [Entamoeba histolytica]